MESKRSMFRLWTLATTWLIGKDRRKAPYTTLYYCKLCIWIGLYLKILCEMSNSFKCSDLNDLNHWHRLYFTCNVRLLVNEYCLLDKLECKKVLFLIWCWFFWQLAGLQRIQVYSSLLIVKCRSDKLCITKTFLVLWIFSDYSASYQP